MVLDNIREKFEQNKVLWSIFIVLSALVVIALIVIYFFTSSSEQPTTTATTPAATKPKIAQPVSAPEAVLKDSVVATSADTGFAALVTEDLENQPLPEQPALAKDELRQLSDIQKQLKDQKQLLEKQSKSADELIKLKEQEIADLEQQLKAAQ